MDETIATAVRADRLRGDIESTAEFGAIDGAEGRGRTVLAGTEANRAAREYLRDRLDAAGLDVTVDRVGNIVGRWCPASADPDAAPIAVGSHLDSVPEGGIFDGPLGVYAALEAVRAIQEAGLEPVRPVEVVCFTEEEGQRFSEGLLGSSVATGKRSPAEALALEDENGTTLEAALEEIGYLGTGSIDASEWAGWFELHVEQDTVLESLGVPVGVVTTITGIAHATATIDGEANHAGATAMGDRRDALAAAAEFVLEIESTANEIVAESSPSAVGTVGSMQVAPNATNVVPGSVTMGVDIRDVDFGSMQRLLSAAETELDRLTTDRGVETAFDREMVLEPTPMSDRLRDVVHEAGKVTGIETHDMHSGAAHDTMHIADVTDAVLLFAPSKQGISHNPREWTDWEDCTSATRVLATAIGRTIR